MILKIYGGQPRVESLKMASYYVLETKYELTFVADKDSLKTYISRLFHDRVSKPLDFDVIKFVDGKTTEVDIPIPLEFCRRNLPIEFKVGPSDGKDGCAVTRVLEKHCDFVRVTPACIDLTLGDKTVSLKPNKELEAIIQLDKDIGLPRIYYFILTLPKE